jgi:hypothetical protein
VAQRLAQALGLALDELAGAPGDRIKLEGSLTPAPAPQLQSHDPRDCSRERRALKTAPLAKAASLHNLGSVLVAVAAVRLLGDPRRLAVRAVSELGCYRSARTIMAVRRRMGQRLMRRSADCAPVSGVEQFGAWSVTR